MVEQGRVQSREERGGRLVEELVIKEEEEAAPEGKERGFNYNAALG